LSCARKPENNGPFGIAKMALKKIVNFNVDEEKLKIEEKVELEQIEVREKRSAEKVSEEGKIVALKKHLLENLMETADEKNRKRDEKLAYIWYAELEYWIEKQIEKIGNGQEEMEKMEFLRGKLAESTEKMGKLRIWIGKEYRRRK
jgi:hypothetical protein